MTDLVWLHEDALRADHPVFRSAGDEVRCVFVWDEDYLKQMDYGFKRLLFIYETLLELGCDILRGNLRDCLIQQARQSGGRLLIPATPNPVLGEVIQQLEADIDIEVVADTAFVVIAKEPDLARFFRYWNTARKSAFIPGDDRQTER